MAKISICLFILFKAKILQKNVNYSALSLLDIYNLLLYYFIKIKEAKLMLTILLIRKIIQLFIIMFFGFITVKAKILKTGDSIVLSKICLYLLMPCVIINAFQVNFTPELRSGLYLAFGTSVAIHIFLIILGYGLKYLFKFDDVEEASVIYSNSANIIIPLVTAMLGEEWIIYSSAFVTVQIIFMWTHGVQLFSKDSDFNIKKIVFNINIIAIFLGIIMLVSGIRFPSIINEAFSSVADMIGPVAMLITGMLIANMDIKNMLKRKKIYIVILFRTIICPAIILLAIKLTDITALVKNGEKVLLVTFLATATPAASTITQFAQLYNKDSEYAGAISILTTLLCIVTLPVLVYIYLM